MPMDDTSAPVTAGPTGDALTDLEAGNVTAALQDIGTAIATFWDDDVKPAVAQAWTTFITDFTSLFGQQAFAAAGTAVASAEAGASIHDVVGAVETALGADAISDAKSAGIDTANVLYNAVRVNMALNAAPATAATATTSATPTTVTPTADPTSGSAS